VVRQETWSYSTCGLVNAQSVMHMVFQLYVLRFDSALVIKAAFPLVNRSPPKLDNQFFGILKYSACINMLLG